MRFPILLQAWGIRRRNQSCRPVQRQQVDSIHCRSTTKCFDLWFAAHVHQTFLGALFPPFLHVIEHRAYLLPQYTTPIHARYPSMTVLFSLFAVYFFLPCRFLFFFFLSSSESLFLLHIQVVDRFYIFFFYRWRIRTVPIVVLLCAPQNVHSHNIDGASRFSRCWVQVRKPQTTSPSTFVERCMST